MMLKLRNFSLREGFRRLVHAALISITVLGVAAFAQTPVQNEVTKLVASDGAASDRFGESVAIFGSTAVIGTSETINAGYLFERHADGTWLQVIELVPSDGVLNDFGSAVGVSEGAALIGAASDDEQALDAGAAYLFERQAGGDWAEAGKLFPSDPSDWQQFGSAVAIDGDVFVVGAPALGDIIGSAYVFERQSDGSWIQSAKLTASDAVGGELFGGAVAVCDGAILIGARSDDDLGTGSGSAYVFEKQSDGAWTEVKKLLASDGYNSDRFGTAVSISGNFALIGAYAHNHTVPDSGAAYVFERQADGDWIEVAKLWASDFATYDRFGISVALENNVAVIGSREDDDNGEDSGSAYVFVRQPDGTWMEVSKLLPSDGEELDYFGNAIAVSNGAVLVGALLDDDNGTDSGSAYVFEIDLPQAGCEPVVDPTSLDFGEIKVGETVSLATTLTNEGDEDCNVAAYVDSSSGEFLLDAAIPATFTVEPGESADVLVDYAPVDMGDDTGALELAFTDPADDILVGLTGRAAEEVFDLDIAQFRVSRAIRYRGGSTRPVSITLSVSNQGTLEGSVPATVTGVRADSVTVYAETVEVWDGVGGGPSAFEFPEYKPVAAGDITWTVTFDDGYPDIDEATATTRVW